MKCDKSGVIFLSRTDHMCTEHYSEKKHYKYHHNGDRKNSINCALEDTERRKRQFKSLIANKKWLDVGCGSGAVLEALSPFAEAAAAVEPQSLLREQLIDLGHHVYEDIGSVPADNYEIVTLFHVFEHFVNPIGELKALSEKMVSGGKIIIEVPHANDFLLSFLGNKDFKEFTLWSEHLILHTRQSLELFLKEAGFKNIIINGIQRFPLANHLHWLVKGKPGGHKEWHSLRTDELEQAYFNLLNQIDKTDTLVAIAENK